MLFGIVTDSLRTTPLEAVTVSRKLGFDALEIGFASPYEDHPLWSEEGATRLEQAAAEAGVMLGSVCPHIFNQIGFADEDPIVRGQAVSILEGLMSRCHQIGIKTILLPFFGKQLLETDAHIERAIETLKPFCDSAGEKGIRLALETTVSAQRWRALVEDLDHPAVGIYYDVGNAVGLGFDPVEDLPILAPHLAGIHIKDRHSRQWDTVMLGQGDVNFEDTAKAIRETGFPGPLILETAFEDDPIEDAAKNLTFIRRFIS